MLVLHWDWWSWNYLKNTINITFFPKTPLSNHFLPLRVAALTISSSQPYSQTCFLRLMFLHHVVLPVNAHWLSAYWLLSTLLSSPLDILTNSCWWDVDSFPQICIIGALRRKKKTYWSTSLLQDTKASMLIFLEYALQCSHPKQQDE